MTSTGRRTPARVSFAALSLLAAAATNLGYATIFIRPFTGAVRPDSERDGLLILIVWFFLISVPPVALGLALPTGRRWVRVATWVGCPVIASPTLCCLGLYGLVAAFYPRDLAPDLSTGAFGLALAALAVLQLTLLTIPVVLLTGPRAGAFFR